MGKLAILKLREDYRQKMGAEYTLQKFHDAFIALGPLPLPLIRQAMLARAARCSEGGQRRGSRFTALGRVERAPCASAGAFD
jgi:uncharacterized protein DUF885